jgi:hypothetical protein
MAAVVTTFAADYWAQVLLGRKPAPTYIVQLYVNLRIPTTEDTVGNYTLCTWPGYSGVILQPGQWSGGAVLAVATYTYPLVTFNFDASGAAQQTIFGYIVIDQAGNLYWAEAFPAPFPIPPGGGSVPLILNWADQQC